MTRDNLKTWAVVLNGTRCRVVRGLPAKEEGAPSELVLRSQSRNLRQIMADKPGRSFSSTGGGRRSAMEYSSDPIAEDQKEFIRQVVALLESHRCAGDFDKLAIFAKHDMLGHLRQLMPQSMHHMVIHEVPKNLVQLPASELLEVISREIGNGRHVS
jgi:protein required for attachment to host cells